MTIGEWLRRAESALEAADCPDPSIDARWMMEDAMNMTRGELRFENNRALPQDVEAALEDMLKRRASGEPVQYILGRADFMGLKFYVDERVLIPRQDTETLCEAAISRLVVMPAMPAPMVLDLCAGSGAVGLSIKTLVPNASVTLTDVSAGAVEVIKKNAHALGADVLIRHGDLFRPVKSEKYDLIVCNPPYISARELPQLQREVQREPDLALNGGEDGLDFYRRIAQEAKDHLKTGGQILLEVGQGQAQDVLTLMLEALGSSHGSVINDLCGVERVVCVRYD